MIDFECHCTEQSELSFLFYYCPELINFTQPIYVRREDPNSRQNTIKSIIERANSKLDWPQVNRQKKTLLIGRF